MTEKDVEIQKLRRQRDLLLQEVAELREKQRWISVKEKLPDKLSEHFKEVLVAIPNIGYPKKTRIFIGRYDITLRLWCVDYYWYKSEDILCWMPLPEVVE